MRLSVAARALQHWDTARAGWAVEPGLGRAARRLAPHNNFHWRRRSGSPPTSSRRHGPSTESCHERSAAPWWRSAVIYQVYIRSFADGNGDGVGDIAGLRVAPRVPGRARRRRRLDQPVVPVADDRRRLRRVGLPRHRAPLRHAGRGRGADRRGPRARPAGPARHRAQPYLRPARVVPGGAGGAAPARPSAARFIFRDGRGAHGEQRAQRLAAASSADRPGPG